MDGLPIPQRPLDSTARTEIILSKHQQRESVSNEQTEQTYCYLHGRNLPGQPVLPEWAAPDEPQVQNGEIAGLKYAPGVRILRDAEQLQLGEQPQPGRDKRFGLLVLPFGDAGLEQAGGARVEMRQAVAWTGDQAEELWDRVAEVEDLWDEQEEQGLGEMTQDGDHDEDHACEVAVRVADEDAGRVLVVGEEGEGDSKERK